MSALGEPSRLAIFRLLVEASPEGLHVGAIAEHLTVAAGTLSFHLKTLSHAGLIKACKDRQFIRYSANFTTMNELVAYLTDNCCGGHPERCAPAADGADQASSTETTPHAA